MSRFSIPQPALVRALPFALFIALLALRGVVDGSGTLHWLYALQAGATAAALALLWHHYRELREHTGAAPLLQGLAAVAAGLVVFVLWITLTDDWMRVGEPVAGFIPVNADGTLQWPLIAARLAGAALVVPVMEELFWRSLVMRWIDRRDFLSLPPREVSLYALCVSSAVFALAHDLWLAGLIAGLVFGALYRWTGRIWHAIVAHAVANLALGLWVVQQRAWGFW